MGRQESVELVGCKTVLNTDDSSNVWVCVSRSGSLEEDRRGGVR